MSACDEEASLAAALNRRSFVLDVAQGFEPVGGTTVTLSFQDGELGFSAGCNGHGGPFRIRSRHLVVSELSSTLEGCNAELQAQDEWLTAFMTSKPSYDLDGDRLILTGTSATLVFLDREVAIPDRPLATTPWVVDTLLDGDSASKAPRTGDPTILFDEDGSLTIDTGCNDGSGHYAVSGSRLTLTDVVYSDQACEVAAATDSHIRKVLANGTLTFEIEATRLTLQRGDTGLGALAP